MHNELMTFRIGRRSRFFSNLMVIPTESRNLFL